MCAKIPTLRSDEGGTDPAVDSMRRRCRLPAQQRCRLWLTHPARPSETRARCSSSAVCSSRIVRHCLSIAARTWLAPARRRAPPRCQYSQCRWQASAQLTGRSSYRASSLHPRGARAGPQAAQHRDRPASVRATRARAASARAPATGQAVGNAAGIRDDHNRYCIHILVDYSNANLEPDGRSDAGDEARGSASGGGREHSWQPDILSNRVARARLVRQSSRSRDAIINCTFVVARLPASVA